MAVCLVSSYSMFGAMSSGLSARPGSLNVQVLILARRSSRNVPSEMPARRSLLVPAMSWNLLFTGVSEPTGSHFPSSMARRRTACSSGPSSPISSRNRMPLLASRRSPGRSAAAPVNDPFLCPKRVLMAMSPRRVAQLISTKFPSRLQRFWRSW